VIEARDLKGEDLNGLSDPMVEVSVKPGGKKQHTAVKHR
jgi:hypothetical protein